MYKNIEKEFIKEASNIFDYMNSPVQKIKERLSIEEVVSSYIKLEKAGVNLKARCPFHNEKTASFFVSPERNSYYCFGCGAKGDIFTFVEEFEGLDFRGALKILANRAGVILEEFNKQEESLKEKLYGVMQEATDFFIKNLNQNQEVLDYLISRGLNKKTIEDFKIGFAKLEWRNLYTHLKQKGFSDLEIEKAGLAKKPDGKKDFYDRFRGRIMFPMADSSGRIIAFSGRLFQDDEKSAKYLNSPETIIFNKSSILYGLNRAKDSIRKNNFSILVEGQFDLILSHQAGFRNTVATSGTALSDATFSKENVVSNLGLIRRLSNNIVLAFDSDKAGFNASGRASKIALSFGMDVKVVSMEEGVDPADLISQQGVEAWKKVIRNSKHIIEFLLGKILKDYSDDTRKAGREIKEKILPYVDALESSIEKAHFIKRISEESQIPESALKEDLKKVEQELKYEKKETQNIQNVENKIFRRDYILNRLLGIIWWQENSNKNEINIKEVLAKLSLILGKDMPVLLKEKESSKEDLIFEAEVFYDNNQKLEKEIDELLNNLEEENLKEKLSIKMRDLNVAERDKNIKVSSEILKAINEINNRIQNIKNSRSKK